MKWSRENLRSNDFFFALKTGDIGQSTALLAEFSL
jgi:hypothetical protein